MPRPEKFDTRAALGNSWRLQVCERLITLFKQHSENWTFAYKEPGGPFIAEADRSKFMREDNTWYKRMAGETGLTKWLRLTHRYDKNKYLEIMCDIHFRDKVLTSSFWHNVQLKVPTANTGLRHPTATQGKAFCDGRWVMQAWGTVSADRWDIEEVTDMRLIPMWLLPLVCFRVPAQGRPEVKDPTKVMVNVTKMTELVEPWHPWSTEKPKNLPAPPLGMRTPAVIYIPARIQLADPNLGKKKKDEK